MDQAEELRNVIKKTESENKEARQDHHCHKWKGRCGKIQHCRNLAVQFQRMGLKTIILMQISDLQTWK